MTGSAADMVPAWVDGVLTPVEKLQVHRLGLRHLAVSVFVMAGDKTLLQRRALGKYHTPGLWTNTCCTHPLWGEDPADCAARRLAQEMGIRGLALRAAGTIEYRADVGQGLTEHELVSLFFAEAPETMPFDPNPAEVMAAKWVDRAALAEQVKADPAAYTPWLAIYLEAGVGQMVPA
jgi:isopentenyl-diphosphate delta-isomerase